MGDLVVCMKGSFENLACPKNASNIPDAIVKDFELVKKMQVLKESLGILCKTELQKVVGLILNS